LIAEIGAQVPLHAGASAKALLAFMAPEEIDAVIAHGLRRLGPGTITNAGALRRDLARTRRRGWALSVEETNEGATGVAVPVFGPGGEVAASLAIAGPLTRFTRQRRVRFVALARGGAAEIARMLGTEPNGPRARWPRRGESS